MATLCSWSSMRAIPWDCPKVKGWQKVPQREERTGETGEGEASEANEEWSSLIESVVGSSIQRELLQGARREGVPAPG